MLLFFNTLFCAFFILSPLIHSAEETGSPQSDLTQKEKDLLTLPNNIEKQLGEFVDFDPINKKVTEAFAKVPKFLTEAKLIMLQKISDFDTLFPKGLEATIADRTKNHTIRLTENEVSCIVANIFLNKFHKKDLIPRQLLNGLFTDNLLTDDTLLSRIMAFTNYFLNLNEPERLISFTKVFAPVGPLSVKWANSDKPLCEVVVETKIKIENTKLQENLQVIFANKSFGGNILSNGNGQEEILLLTHPDAIAGLAFLSAMKDNEAIVISGAKRISKYEGYGKSFKIRRGIYDDSKTPRVDLSIQRTFVAMDAINFKSNPRLFQTSEESIIRELTKLYAGFQSSVERPSSIGVATGFWGCGDFGGNKAIKAILQWLAVSESGRPHMIFSSYNDKDFAREFESFIQAINSQNLKVGDLFNRMIQCVSGYSRNINNDIIFSRMLMPPYVPLKKKKLLGLSPNIGILAEIIPFNYEGDKISKAFDMVPEFITKAMPIMLEKALGFDTLFPEGLEAITDRSKSQTITLNEGQVSCIVANIFFNNFLEKGHTFPKLSNRFFTSDLSPPILSYRIRAFANYFLNLNEPKRPISFTRVFAPVDSSLVKYWANSDKPLCEVVVETKIKIENTEPQRNLQVIFANKSFGGNVLSNGDGQEEILLLTHPDAIAGLALFPIMKDNEAIVISGAKRISKYEGYGKSFKINEGIFDDSKTPRVSLRIQRAFVAMDAINFKESPKLQTDKESIIRELTKLYTGFQLSVERPSSIGVATGFWGCGMFGGNKAIKAILQWLAVSESGRPHMIFSSYNDKGFAEEFNNFIQAITLQSLKVGDLFNRMIQYFLEHQEVENEKDFFLWMAESPIYNGPKEFPNILSSDRDLIHLEKVGLLNFDSTCYMNAVLQCLKVTWPLTRYYLDGSYCQQTLRMDNPPISNGEMSKAYATHLNDMLTHNDRTNTSTKIFETVMSMLGKPDIPSGPILPVFIRNHVRKYMNSFESDAKQQDASEFLINFIDILHEEYNVAKREKLNEEEDKNPQLTIPNQDDSFISSLMYVVTKGVLICPEEPCKHVPKSVKYRSNSNLLISITGKTLVECLEKHFSEEILDGENSYKCGECKKPVAAKKSLGIWISPKILIISLKRFKCEFKNGDYKTSKIEELVSCPLELDIGHLMAKDAPQGHHEYDLYAVLNHKGGTPNNGHYTANTRSFDGTKWYKCNDGDVKILEDPVISNEAYILFL